jgi:anti-sigma regulatory factor (Ser/Thr protein kinase)
MTTILEAVESTVGPLVPALALKSITATLEGPDQEIGTLDVLRMQVLLDHVSTGLKIFTSRVDSNVARQLKTRLARGGFPAPCTASFVITNDADVVLALRQCQIMTRRFFPATDVVRINTAVSELARNAHVYAKRGDLSLSLTESSAGYAFELVIIDEGPGIPEAALSLSGKYVSKTGLGRGLIGAKALLDVFEIDSRPGRTRIRGVKRSRHA